MHIYIYIFLAFMRKCLSALSDTNSNFTMMENNSVRGSQFRNGISTTFKQILHQQTDIWSCDEAEL